MGRRNKGKRKNSDTQHKTNDRGETSSELLNTPNYGTIKKHKKRKVGSNKKWPNNRSKLWIMDCKESSRFKNQEIALRIMITRNEIHDDHISHPKSDTLACTNLKFPVEDSNEVCLETPSKTSSRDANPLTLHDAVFSQQSETIKHENQTFSKNDTSHEKNSKTTDPSSSSLGTETMIKRDKHDLNDFRSSSSVTRDDILTANDANEKKNSIVSEGNNSANTSPEKDKVLPEDISKSKPALDMPGTEQQKTSKNIDGKVITSKINPYVLVLRSSSAKGKPKCAPNSGEKSKNRHLSNGDCGDGIVNPYPESKVQNKYWAQRKRLFTKFDSGIQLDEESWFSVTPEVIADHVAKRIGQFSYDKDRHLDTLTSVRTPDSLDTDSVGIGNTQDQKAHVSKTGGLVVVDAFCGCGGNAIALAKRPSSEISHVVCIDIDKTKLQKLAHNASIYGIPADRLTLIKADALDVLGSYKEGELHLAASRFDQNLEDDLNDSQVDHESDFKIKGIRHLPQHIDTVFLSPPWGGTEYINQPSTNGFSLDVDICINRNRVQHKSTVTSSTMSSTQYDIKDQNASSNQLATVDGSKLLEISSAATSSKLVTYFLPRNINGISVGRAAISAGYQGEIEMEQNILNGKLKTVTVYFGMNGS